MTLQIDENQQLNLNIEDFIGKSVAVLGSTGTGKTNTVAVLIEEIASHVPCIIVDIEGEYYGLKEQFDFLVVGKSPHVDIEITANDASAVARYAHEQGISVILDLLEYDHDQQTEFMLNFFSTLWQAALQQPKPLQIVLEEAHEWIPQTGNVAIKNLLARIALRGRKRGLGIILASQRPAKVSKDILTQARMLFLHKVYYPTDIRVYQDILPLATSDSAEMIGGLEVGHAIFMSNYQAQALQIRRRSTFHGGTTPELEGYRVPEIKPANADTLAALKGLIATPISENTSDVILLRSENRRLKEELKKQRDYYEEQLSVLNSELKRRNIAVQMNLEGWKNNAIERQRVRLGKLIETLKSVPRFHVDMLMFLIEHEGHQFNTEELATALSLSYNSVSGSPPKKLIELGLVERDGRPAYYHSCFRSYVDRYLPDIGYENVMAVLMNELQGVH